MSNNDNDNNNTETTERVFASKVPLFFTNGSELCFSCRRDFCSTSSFPEKSKLERKIKNGLFKEKENKEKKEMNNEFVS